MLMKQSHRRSPSSSLLSAATALLVLAGLPAQKLQPNAPLQQLAPNPYKLDPFVPDLPVELEYPPANKLEYEGTRRRMLERLASNLTGGGRRETWIFATEFFWRAPDDAVEPLTEAMDRAMGNPAHADIVKNCVEAMGKTKNPAFDEALRRAAEHSNASVQQAAWMAMATCGSPATLREMKPSLAQMDGRARSAWFRALRLRMGAEGVEMLRESMMYVPGQIRDEVLREALQLGSADAAKVLRVHWEQALDEFKAIIAGVLHAAGDTAGTSWLLDALTSEDLARLVWAIQNCHRGELGPLREPLLRTTTHLRPEVRLAAAKALFHVEGEDVADIYEVLAAPDESWEVRALALHQLTRRGRTGTLAVMLDELPTATGTRLSLLLNQLTATGDPRAVPIMLARFRKAPEGEGRSFVQSLGANFSPEATRALCELFVGPEHLIARGGATGVLTTRNYIPTMLLNQRGRESLVVECYSALARDQFELRARLLPTLGGIAADRQDQAVKEACVAPIRKVLFDREELPQLRVLALNLLALKWLTIDDLLALKNSLHQEQPGMRRLLTDFLLDVC